jgi:MoxR-like ATPase
MDAIEACVDEADVGRLREAVQQVRVSEELKRYIVDLVAATRTAEGVDTGGSPRASITLMKVAQALSMFDGEDYVKPESVQEICVPVIAHRLVMNPQARFAGLTAERVVHRVMESVTVPA